MGRARRAGAGSRLPRALAPSESLRDAVVVSASGYLWTDDGDGDE